jgi:cell fate regulator YaaT (PSP1 superfamily)
MGNNSKLVEVVFKGERRLIFRNRNDLEIKEGDRVVVEAERGEDMGRVSLVGALVKLKRGKGETRSVIRIATDKDRQTLKVNETKEVDLFETGKQKIKEYKLDMKLIDVEMQFDGSKITFFFTAAQRVDFRDLVKELAGLYRTRIELRQIGVRDEAKRISGFGVCGCKQCCSSFLTEFEQITTQMAKDQQISLNPSKISGNCGRLLCCLKYEEDAYMETYKHFPQMGSPCCVDNKKGTLAGINMFKCTGHVYYQDGTNDWLTPEEIEKGKKNNEPQQ